MKEESQARVARISGAGHLPGGEYESIHISGSAKIDGDAVCQEDVHVSGAATAKGDLAAKEIHVSGSLQVEGDVHAEAVRVSGSAHVAGGMEVCGEMRVSGSARRAFSSSSAETFLPRRSSVSALFDTISPSTNANFHKNMPAAARISAAAARIQISVFFFIALRTTAPKGSLV